METRPFWDTLAEGRECGGCTECCRVFKIDAPTLTKPAGTLCAHAAGGGCSIHSARPDVCRGWFCLWRRIASVPDALRPDRLGVIVSYDYGSVPGDPFGAQSIILREIRPGALDSADARALLAMFCAQDAVPVWLSRDGDMHRHHPDDALAVRIERPAADDAEPERIANWRRALDLDPPLSPPGRNA